MFVDSMLLFCYIQCLLFPNNMSSAFEKGLHFSESGYSPLQNQETLKCRASFAKSTCKLSFFVYFVIDFYLLIVYIYCCRPLIQRQHSVVLSSMRIKVVEVYCLGSETSIEDGTSYVFYIIVCS